MPRIRRTGECVACSRSILVENLGGRCISRLCPMGRPEVEGSPSAAPAVPPPVIADVPEPEAAAEPSPPTVESAAPAPANLGAQWIRDAKATEGKVPMHTILQGFAPALRAIARVSVMGYHKHTKRAREKLVAEEGATPAQAAAAIPYNNWQNGTPETYADAAARHLIDRASGEEKPSDSDELHLTHECWNKLAELTLVLRAQEAAQ